MPKSARRGLAAVVEQDVRGLHVAVDEAPFVDVGERRRQRPGQLADLAHGERPALHARRQGGAVDEVGDDVGAPVGAGLGAAVVQG
jgi:hypothetical protein